MFREITHFLRNAPELMRLHKELSRAEFMDMLHAEADAHGFADVRRELVADLSGRVLEIGCGTGSLFQYYGDAVEVEAIEPEEDFRAFALARARKTVRVASGDGMRLTFPEASFDAVVVCLVLCSVPSVKQVLAEALRVLRQGGRLRALEHVRSERAVPGFLMDVANPLWLRLNKQGCNWNRQPLPVIEAAGFAVEDLRAFQRFDPLLPAFPMQRIRAHKPQSIM